MRFLWLSLFVVACGSKTDLGVGALSAPLPEPDAAVDEALDESIDAPDDGPAPDRQVLEECRPFVRETGRAPLTIYLLVDDSGSMSGFTALGVSKAVAVGQALGAFAEAPGSDDVRLGLTVFPTRRPVGEQPILCETDDECEGTPCSRFSQCVSSGLSGCAEDEAICGARDECVVFGSCSLTGAACFLRDVGRDPCQFDGQGLCVDRGVCGGSAGICASAPYRTTDVGPLEVPEGAEAIQRILAQRETRGGTPTLGVLRGTLDSIEGTPPPGRAIVLLATDGFPSACTGGDEIAALETAAAEGLEAGVSTYLVGVFSPEEQALAEEALSRVAIAGGTDEAIVLTEDTDVATRLTEVLREVREEAQECTYSIPQNGGLPDPRDVEVRLLDADGARLDLPRLPDRASCAIADEGYFIGGDENARPTTVELCGRACGRVEVEDLGVEIEADCLI
ncbi:MAG: hypothetical protein AAF938_02185 [Myxococcota bacterium]